jgi:cytochrome c-type biogenesis protein CcmH/NrfF
VRGKNMEFLLAVFTVGVLTYMVSLWMLPIGVILIIIAMCIAYKISKKITNPKNNKKLKKDDES